MSADEVTVSHTGFMGWGSKFNILQSKVSPIYFENSPDEPPTSNMFFLFGLIYFFKSWTRIVAK